MVKGLPGPDQASNLCAGLHALVRLGLSYLAKAAKQDGPVIFRLASTALSVPPSANPQARTQLNTAMLACF